ncbi:MAG: hypothetical protein LUP94_02225 [Candidatus Methanomethylicus sp.]|nr:hypothetical protein [Candidatus Methanomethylicus sp.]
MLIRLDGEEIRTDLPPLPSGECLREAKIGIFEVGPLHNVLRKGLSEPDWIGESKRNIGR